MRGVATVEPIEHTGDVGLSIKAESLAELFEVAARAMFDLMVDGDAPPAFEDPIELSEESTDRLLREFLSDLLYQFSAEGKVCSRVRVDAVTPTHLKAVAFGAAFDASKHRLKTELKAVTYHQLDVRPEGDAWRARVIFDV